MIKKLSIFVFFTLILCGISMSQVTPPTLSTGEYWTNMWSLSYDYQTNGSVKYIVQDPSNPDQLLAIFMGTHDSSSAAGTNRYVWYAYSTNKGRTWDANNITNSFFAGFPSATVSSTGTPYVGMHLAASPTRGFLYSDAAFTAGSWSEVGVIPQTPAVIIWPHITATSNGNVVFVAAPNDGATFLGHYNTWNGSAWFANNVLMSQIGGPSGNFSTESGANGNVYIFGSDYAGTGATALFTSTNNGINFALQSGSNAPPAFLLSGADTMIADIAGGRSGLYVGNEVHLVYAVYGTGSVTLPNPPNTNLYYHAKIVHWSPSTGIDTIAGRSNMPTFADTLTQVNMTPLCHPVLGSYNGYLYCAFTAFMRGNKQTVDDGSIVNAGEIYMSFSVDNGNTWTTPVNITNTPSIEEKHPSVFKNFVRSGTDSLSISYVRDMKAGSWVNVAGWGKAPVYSIYRKISPSLFPIGIKQDLEVVRDYKLFQNYPNPFNPSTTISYNLQKNGFVTLKVYNVLGSLVATLVNGEQTKGAKEISFDGSNLASGIYYYTIETEGFRDTKKMILVK